MAISALYGSGETGDWWLPVSGKCWQDTGGSTPATAHGDPIARIDGQQGAINLLQSTSGNRPTLDTSDISGREQVYTAGTKYFDTLAFAITRAGGLTFFSGHKISLASTYQLFFEQSPFYNPMMFLKDDNKYGWNIGTNVGGVDNMIAQSDPSTAPSGYHTLIARVKESGASFESSIWVEGTKVVSTTGTYFGPDGTDTYTVFNRATGSLIPNLRTPVFGWRGKWSDDTEVATLHADITALLSAPAAGGKGFRQRTCRLRPSRL